LPYKELIFLIKKYSIMKSSRTNEKILGVLFLLPFLAFGIGNELLTSEINDSNIVLQKLTTNTKSQIGAYLVLLNSTIVVCIGIFVYPILHEFNRKIALGYISGRIIEALLLIIGLIAVGSFLSVGSQLQNSHSDSTSLEIFVLLTRQIHFWSYQIAMISLALGSIGFCYLLFKWKLIPRLVSVIGLAGYTLLAVGALMEISGIPLGIILSIPGGIFEITIALILLVKGFNYKTLSHSSS
jgi:hypothetical protein